jgi:hypothetical protein
MAMRFAKAEEAVNNPATQAHCPPSWPHASFNWLWNFGLEKWGFF